MKGGLKTLRCTMGSAKEAGAVMMRIHRDTGMFSARALRSISPKEAASAAKLSWPRHSDMGCAAHASTCPGQHNRCHPVLERPPHEAKAPPNRTASHVHRTIPPKRPNNGPCSLTMCQDMSIRVSRDLHKLLSFRNKLSPALKARSFRDWLTFAQAAVPHKLLLVPLQVCLRDADEVIALLAAGRAALAAQAALQRPPRVRKGQARRSRHSPCAAAGRHPR